MKKWKFYGWWSDTIAKKRKGKYIINAVNEDGEPVEAVAMTNRNMPTEEAQKRLASCFGLKCKDLVPLGIIYLKGKKK